MSNQSYFRALFPKIAFLVFANLAMILAAADSQTIDKLTLMSEDFPPYNYIENGEATGPSVELTVAILRELHSVLTRADIQFMPWSRSYLILQKDPNAVLFATTRTKERENLFKWVGPISSARNVLMSKKIRHVRIRDPKDLSKFKIGVVLNDAGQQLIEKLGIPTANEDIADSGEMNVKKLIGDRFEVIAYDENVVRWMLKKEGQNPDDYETVYLLSEGEHYFAFNREVPDEVITAFQSALDKLKRNGVLDQIINKYLAR